jgi:hypothetical protein
MGLSIEECVFLVEYVFRQVPPRSLDLIPPEFILWGAAKSAVYRDGPHTLNELKTAIITYIGNILQADLQKVFEKKLNGIRPV